MFFVYFWPAIVWTGVILILVLIPGSDLPDWNWIDSLSFDKLIHFIIFYILIILVLNGCKKININNKVEKQHILFSLLYGIGLSGGTELLQDALYIARKADFFDFIANSIGCILATILFPQTITKFEKIKNTYKKLNLARNLLENKNKT